MSTSGTQGTRKNCDQGRPTGNAFVDSGTPIALANRVILSPSWAWDVKLPYPGFAHDVLAGGALLFPHVRDQFASHESSNAAQGPRHAGCGNEKMHFISSSGRHSRQHSIHKAETAPRRPRKGPRLNSWSRDSRLSALVDTICLGDLEVCANRLASLEKLDTASLIYAHILKGDERGTPVVRYCLDTSAWEGGCQL